MPKWTPEQLRPAYWDLPDKTAAERLLTLLDWATQRGALLDARAKNPVFGEACAGA